jgi:hypothetical protein
LVLARGDDRLEGLRREGFLPRSEGFRLLRIGLLGLFFRDDERVVLRFRAMGKYQIDQCQVLSDYSTNGLETIVGVVLVENIGSPNKNSPNFSFRREGD